MYVQRAPLRQSFHAAQSQQRTVGPPSMERFSVTKTSRPNHCPFTVARDSRLDSVQPNRSALRAARTSSAKLSRGPSQQRTVGPPSMERFSVTKIVQYRTVVHSRWLETPVSIQCSRIFQRHVQRLTSSAKLSRGPEPTEDCWATVNGTLLGNQKSPSTEHCPFTVARDSCLDSVQPNRSASRAAHSSSAELSRGPEPTEDCWATVNGTLLGNQKSSSTEQSSIHGGSRLLSRFSAAKSFSVTCSVVGYSLASHPQWLA